MTDEQRPTTDVDVTALEVAIGRARDALLLVDEDEAVLSVASKVTLAVLPVFIAEFEALAHDNLALVMQARHETAAACTQRDEIADAARAQSRALRMFGEEVSAESIAMQVTAGFRSAGHDIDGRDEVFIQAAVSQTVRHLMRSLLFAVSTDAQAVLEADL